MCLGSDGVPNEINKLIPRARTPLSRGGVRCENVKDEISTRTEILNVITTKFQARRWGWNLLCNHALRLQITISIKSCQVIRPEDSKLLFLFKVPVCISRKRNCISTKYFYELHCNNFIALGSQNISLFKILILIKLHIKWCYLG